MSELPISSKYRSRPHEPVSENERNALSAQLNQEYADGTIAAEDYQPLLDQVFAAKTLGDLAPVVQRLGKPATYDTPAIVADGASGRPGELTPGRSASPALTIAVVGGVVAALVLIVLLLVLFLG